MALQKEFLDMIEEDIRRIDDAIANGTDTSRWELFRELDGKYQVCIDRFYEGMWLSVPNKNILHFPDLKKYPDYVIDNLKMAKSKLAVFRFQGNAVALPEIPATQVNVTTNVNVNITFEQVRSKIEDMTSLTDEQTKEAQGKVAEIESVVKGEGSKKSKWEKIKPILAWLADKSFDLATTILPLLLQVQG